MLCECVFYHPVVNHPYQCAALTILLLLLFYLYTLSTAIPPLQYKVHRRSNICVYVVVIVLPCNTTLISGDVVLVENLNHLLLNQSGHVKWILQVDAVLGNQH